MTASLPLLNKVASPFIPGRQPVPERVRELVSFCLVGGSGVVVDMAVLYLLADPKMLALNLTLSKVCAAETALVNNFIWNEVWTFRARATAVRRLGGALRRLLFFNAICGAGIFLAVLLLHFFHSLLGWNLYLSNLLAIALVTFWNFGLNARFNWGREAHAPAKSFASAPDAETRAGGALVEPGKGTIPTREKGLA